MLRLALQSLRNRRATAALVVLAIALSSALLVGVERLRVQAHDSFTNTLYGTDLIVGARTGPISLLLYSVFRIGDATSNIRWASYEAIAARPDVAWAVPLSLGDSHRGFRVLGTTRSYFEHYRFGANEALQLRAGRLFAADGHGASEAVLGAAVARRLGYDIGARIVLAHGMGEVSFAEHADHPFTVVGILAPTGTPVDQTVHVDVNGVEAMHSHGHTAGAGISTVQGLRALLARRAQAQEHAHAQPGAAAEELPGGHAAEHRHDGHDAHADHANHEEHAAHAGLAKPATLSAVLVGLRVRAETLAVQRQLNEYTDEPLLAILPGLTLQQLWDIVGVAENALRVIAAFVLLVSLTVMTAALLTSLNERRREMAILRALGARPGHVFALILGESLLLTGIGALLGLALLQLATVAAAPHLEAEYGILLRAGLPTTGEWALLAATLASGFIAGLVPAWLAYRHSVADGMRVRL